MNEKSQKLEAMEVPGDETSSRGRILVVDDEPNARDALTMLLEEEGYEARSARDGFKALGELDDWDCDILLTDLRMPVMDGLELLRKARQQYPDLACVVMTAFGSVESAVDAMKAGADDYLTKPLNFDAVELVLERTMQKLSMKRELATLRSRLGRSTTGARMIGSSAAMQDLEHMIDQVADARATVLLTGESGTGKELVARLLHEKSSRAERPFVPVHCAALAETLLESELFGHEKGAFTGAQSRRFGRFEEADGGTLFLDEVGEIAPAVQVKLLRFLQERTFRRVGGSETIEVDVRIIAATNRDLYQDVLDDHFREDLYYRLNVIHIKPPPLRARRTDIPLLANHFVARYAEQNDKEIESIAPEVIERFVDYDWPGNVRELENIIEFAVVLCNGDTIEPHHLPRDFGHDERVLAPDVRIPGATLEELERFAILETYESTGGDTRATAEILDVSVRKIQYKIKEYREEGSMPPE